MKIIGNGAVCSNSKGQHYKLEPLYNDSIRWTISNGTIMSKSSDRIFINFDNLGYFSNDTLTAVIIDSQTQCERVIKLPISINAESAPDETSITWKYPSSIMICSDSTINTSYQWGYYNRQNGNKISISGASLRYCQYPDPIDTVNNLYFVKTAREGCSTTTFYGNIFNAIEISENNKDISFTVFPNPSQNIIFIGGSTNEIVSIVLTSQTGQTWERLFNKVSNSIDLTDVAAGYYVIHIVTAQEVYTNKLIIVK
tara:strand:- start:112 stop:876 length:765 start_codon:yes stop_codon:yes gene_type:complete